MKLTTTTLLLCALLMPQVQAQRKKVTHRTTVQQTAPQPANPNVSGQPDVLTAPVMNQASPAPQPQQINMNIKRQKKVRVVPAPPPPGPISPAIPPKE